MHQFAGNAWIREALGLHRFELTHTSMIGSTYKKETDEYENITDLYPKHYAPNPTVLDHLVFALKYDDISLDFLLEVFRRMSRKEIEEYISQKPNGKYERKIGYLYEFLTRETLITSEPTTGNYIDLLEESAYLTGEISKNKRWKVNDNLLGNPHYCPIIRKTRGVTQVIETDYLERINNITSGFSKDIFYRAVKYLYTKETKSSYKIESEEPSQDRVSRFIQLLQQAGRQAVEKTLSEEHLTKLQNEIVDSRFGDKSFRDFQNYVGERISYSPKVHYVCPSPAILRSMMAGFVDSAMKSEKVNAVIKAGMLAFGFVFAHPFDDGNGRLHRFLIHDTLTRDGIVPKGMIIPISARMLMDGKSYEEALERYSVPLMQRIRFDMDGEERIQILNEDALEGYYRYPDLSAQCAYLGKTLLLSIEEDLQSELEFLYRYDDIKKAFQEIVDMPDRLIDLTIKFLHQNNGKIGRKRRMQLDVLTEKEIEKIELAYKIVFKQAAYPKAGDNCSLNFDDSEF